MRTIRKRITADERLALSGKIQLEGDVLAGFVGRERFAIVRLEIERADAVAFLHFFDYAEFAITVPDKAALLGFAALKCGGLDLQTEAFARETLLFALKINAAQGEINHQATFYEDDCQKKIADDQRGVAPQSQLDSVQYI